MHTNPGGILGCSNWLHAPCALQRRCAIREPEGAMEGFFCPECEPPVRRSGSGIDGGPQI
jgi:hypothetical protein